VLELFTGTLKRFVVNSIEEIMNHPWFKGIDFSKLCKLNPLFVPDKMNENSISYFQDRYELNSLDESDILEDIQFAENQVSESGENDINKDNEELLDFPSVSVVNLTQSTKNASFSLHKASSFGEQKEFSLLKIPNSPTSKSLTNLREYEKKTN
jgi:hypothetical protein